MTRMILPAALAAVALLVNPAGRALAESGHAGGSSHGGGSHSGGSHSSGSHGGGSHGGGSHGGGSHGGGSHGGSSHGGSWHGRGGTGHGGGHDGGGHHRGGGHRGGGWIVYPGPYWYGWGWGWDCPNDSDCYGYGPGYGPWYGPPAGSGYGPEYAPLPDADTEEWSIVDIEISPDLSRVYLDGRYIGVASDFDGDPDYLHLKPGNYKLEFRLEGFESWSLNVDVEAGAKIEVNKKLRRAPGTASPRSAEVPTEPEGGVRYFWGKEKGALKAEEGNRNDVRDERDSRDDDDADDSPEPIAEDSGDDAPSSANGDLSPTKLVLSVEPSDAVVYLDGHFLGTAAEVSDGDRGVPLTPGKHTVSILRPGSKDRVEEIEVQRGETKKLEISLP